MEQTLGYGVTPSSAGVGVPQLTSPMSWSQFMGQTLGYGTTPSSSGATALSTSLGGMPGYVPPPPGISIWNIPPLEDMPLLEDAIPLRLVAVLPPKPPTGRAGQLQTNLRMRGIVPQAPQMPTSIFQPPLLPQSRQATLYQQLVQPPSKTTGLGVTFNSSAFKPAPSDSWDTDVCGRLATQG